MNNTTRRDPIVEDYHGTRVADPYRWLEDAASPDTLAWVEAQNAATSTYFAALPIREQIKAYLTAIWNYPKYSVPYKEGGRYFFFKNIGLQNQSVLYMQRTLDSTPVVVIDPNTLSQDGTVAVKMTSFSKDGALLAYGFSRGGSDWQEIHILHIEQNRDYEETIRWSRSGSVAWRHDQRGFFYSRYPEPGTVPEEDQTHFHRVYWHTLDTPQAEDRLIFERPDAKALGFTPHITDDGRYLTLTVWQGTDPHNRFYYREVESDSQFVRLLDDADASYRFIGNSGPLFYFHTTLDAPRGRIIAIDVQHPERAHWHELIPEQDDVLASALIVNHQFVLTYLHDAHHQVKFAALDGSTVRALPLPTLGSISEMSGKPEESELFLTFTSFVYPASIFRYDFSTHTLELFHGTESDFDPAGYETTQVFYPSKDGTRIPMFLTHKKGLPRDGNNPTLLCGYGGFRKSELPLFANTIRLWVEHDGVYAVANLRGGGEYGEEWHRAGMLEKKQNVFDDFIAAAKWLIANKYTNTSKLAISGGSNGGLLVGACMVQRPDLFGAVVCRVPVLDMLRYHRWSVGHYWISEYGDAEHHPEHFKFLYAYSPLHNVKAGVVYPPTLIKTADTDDRVVPAHAKKFAAALQAANGGPHPILLRVETKSGHGVGKPTAKLIDQQSEVYAFLFNLFGI